MKSARIPLLLLRENSDKQIPEGFPIHIKNNRKFYLNCRKAVKHTKGGAARSPDTHQSANILSCNTNMQSDRPSRIKFIKEIQKEIKLIEIRKKVMSLMRCHSEQESSVRNKENAQNLRNVCRAKKESKDSSKCADRGGNEMVPVLSQELKRVEKVCPDRLPKCKVKRVRYRAISKSPMSFWEQVNVSEIEIKENNDEEIATLQRIQIQLNTNRC